MTANIAFASVYSLYKQWKYRSDVVTSRDRFVTFYLSFNIIEHKGRKAELEHAFVGLRISKREQKRI